ncbi:MAG: G-D-S-L family lipolytic protein [Flavobacteriaceae bacterium]|jgi:lysophospholipase L1-like esterase|nr:G-D-S-L family lipolytic protein [Flavobacteriaceae bacterium]
MKNNNFKWLLFASLAIVACSEDIDDDVTVVEPEVTAGSADFSKFISLGNSLTAGFSDNALFIKGQENAYPNIMAAEFAKVGGGEFKIPYMNDNVGGLLLEGNVIAGPRLIFNGSAPVVLPGATPSTEVSSILSGSFNNMGIPGAKSYHLLAPGYGNISGVATGQANPYFVRFASSPSTRVIDDAVSQNPTFFSLWIGNNDVLSYASSGGIGANQTGNPDVTSYGGNDITDPVAFATIYETLLNALTSGGAKGVVANIPYVTTIPYFTTVPYNPVPLEEDTANLLNSNYAVYNGALAQFEAMGLISTAEKEKRTITFHAGSGNAVVILDESLTDLTSFNPQLVNMRQATQNDLIVLTASSFIGTTVGGNPLMINGVSVPLADNWVLTETEIQEVKTATDAYNATIRTLADNKGLAFVDANAILTQIASGGYPSGGFIFKSDFIFGNTFSLDGVHLSPRANGLVANKMMEAINATYGSNFRPVSLSAYPILYGVSIP